MLKRNKRKDRLSHAYLFYGEEGVGVAVQGYGDNRFLIWKGFLFYLFIYFYFRSA